MNEKESRAFLRGEMDFTPGRMMRYVRSRARISTEEDLEDILQNALVMVTQHFDPGHPDANLALYCLGACNKSIAQNLERYHKVILKKRDEKKEPLSIERDRVVGDGEDTFDGQAMQVKTLAPGKSFSDEGAGTSQWRTKSLDSMFAEDDGRSPEDVIGFDYAVVGSRTQGLDPLKKALLKDLIDRILLELPTELHRTCFLLKYVEGYKREDLISCLKMESRRIDTVDKKIVRTLKAFKEKLEKDESRI